MRREATLPGGLPSKSTPELNRAVVVLWTAARNSQLITEVKSNVRRDRVAILGDVATEDDAVSPASRLAEHALAVRSLRRAAISRAIARILL